ncbi:hypothetical protein, variant 5 [Phytophthora nicotianae]|uniref:VPS37 C-terminal domain-containing protein n=1 Tax=Phytophthora nicotianae TaxID=4792 RepID=W2KES0_PHYNI|nr:hypothetical protein, variant 2 [Phytophthora nicotianae]ETL82889.1 hypothetical protein, variant 3 [Phytophthora nicotianae]ETL82890.1 hypothetical protein, variant 4 [Phytophthora nicotianae]ETL82891.1 hypothetical protein, variant 5 [Phytophthora nicotianae]
MDSALGSWPHCHRDRHRATSSGEYCINEQATSISCKKQFACTGCVVISVPGIQSKLFFSKPTVVAGSDPATKGANARYEQNAADADACDPCDFPRARRAIVSLRLTSLERQNADLYFVCSLSQLEKLNSDKHSLKKFVKELTSVKEFTQLRDEVLHSNMGIAKTTLGYEAELRELQEVVEAQRVELRAAQQTLAEKQARQQRIVARHRPDALLEQLAAAAKDVDNESDEIATQFAHGDIDVAQFISTYLPQRNLYHERSLKLARVHQH